MIFEGSIFDVEADAIVNPANSFLRHGGGLAAVIEREALNVGTSAQTGREKPERRLAADTWRMQHAAAPLIATGNVYVTDPGLLPFMAVIHAVGPIWNGGNFMETDLLEMTMESILIACRDHGFDSVAVPAISCGVFGFPIETAARILASVASWGPGDYGVDVTFALTDPEHVAAFRRQISDPLFG